MCRRESLLLNEGGGTNVGKRIGSKGIAMMHRWLPIGVIWIFGWLGPVWGTGTQAASPDGALDMAREDWYLRESLAAIRAWEAILEKRDAQKPPRPGTPVFPVPSDGQLADWPNPIPRMLLPAEDRRGQIRLRWADGRIEVQRPGPSGTLKLETFTPGETILGYKHFGGGGKDQWYHAYHRRFDRLTTFIARPAPLAIALNAPLDLHRGDNEIELRVRNASAGPVSAAVWLEFLTPQGGRVSPQQRLEIPQGAGHTVHVPLRLEQEGGGLAILWIEAPGGPYWVPLLTHVEEVSPILAGIGRMLADHPNPAAAARLAALQARCRQPDPAWRELFEEASRLRDELLLGRIAFDALLFVKRKPYFSEQPFMDAHHLFNRPGGGIYRLSPVRPQGTVRPVVDSLGEGVYRDICLHWDAQRLLFAFGNGSDKWDGGQSYDLYEVRVDGTGLRRLTSGPKNDCEPFYLADGRIAFTSDGSEHFVMCGGDRHSPTLFVAEADGSQVRQLSFNVFNDFNPCLMPDGRILYSRWEYNERSVTSLHNPFTMNPDGTMVQPYYGNATIRPNVVMFPRPVPGSTKVMALFTAHHGQTHGAVGLIDVRRGIDGPEPLEILTPGVPVTGEKAEDSRYGWFSDPWPLAEDLFLASYTPTVLPWLEKSWALYVADRHGNLALVYRDPAISCAEPVPVVPRRVPHVRPSAVPGTDRTDAEAVLVVADVYQGLTGVPRGTAHWIRVLEDVPRKSVPQGGVITTSGTLIFTIKRVLGTVPIEADGSAHFLVPANRNVYFEVLDKDFEEIQRMRSVVCLKPGESRTCIGCHERRSMAPPTASLANPARKAAAPAVGPMAAVSSMLSPEGAALGEPLQAARPPVLAALSRPPSRPAPPPWGTHIVSFLRDVQPVLNARCVSCHAYDRPANGVILTDDLTDRFAIGYEELLPYLAVAISNRWDHPDDVYPRPPYTYGSKVSRLTRLLRAGHHGVHLSSEEWQRLLTWIDCNGVYYDRYETGHYPDRRIFTGSVRQILQQVFERRCAGCHGRDDGRHDTWWLSLNWREPAHSRMLAAPLARAAGGWGRCAQVVFATPSDPDYQTLLQTLQTLSAQLRQHPREDLLSLRGTPAETQRVALPDPPSPRPGEVIPPGTVFLSDLSWESARAGWSPNQDGLPRRDRSIENQAIRVGNRRHAKGLGTHAPSEIIYALDGKYARFQAVASPGEPGGSVVFQVFGDDKKLFDSGVMRFGQSQNIDVPVGGIRRLRLVVTDAGDGYFHDCANWASARVQTP